MFRLNPNLRPFVMVVAAAAIVGGAWFVESMPVRERVAWRQDYGAGLAEAHNAGRPVLLDFTSITCGPCELMKTTTWADRDVAAALGNYVPIRVDIDDHRDLAVRYNIDQPGMGIPLLVVQDANGNVTKAFLGYIDAEQFIAWLKSPATTAPTTAASSQP